MKTLRLVITVTATVFAVGCTSDSYWGVTHPSEQVAAAPEVGPHVVDAASQDAVAQGTDTTSVPETSPDAALDAAQEVIGTDASAPDAEVSSDAGGSDAMSDASSQDAIGQGTDVSSGPETSPEVSPEVSQDTAGDTAATDASQDATEVVQAPPCGGSCDDGNPCTFDVCDAVTGKCEHFPNDNVACTDNNTCTVGDLCKGGVCSSGQLANCNDGNPCTDDSCDPIKGCVHTDNTAACDDGDPHTTVDLCINGMCVGTQKVPCVGPSECNDGNPCTDDSCDPIKGCVHTDNTAACGTASVCMTAGVCQSGICVEQVLNCDDGNPCTTDSCDPAKGCVHLPNIATCDDGNICTVDDACKGGVCVPGSATPTCDDGNPCTTDSCDPVKGCVHTQIQGCTSQSSASPTNVCVRWSDPAQQAHYLEEIYGCVGSLSSDGKSIASCSPWTVQYMGLYSSSGAAVSWCATIPSGMVMQAVAHWTNPCIPYNSGCANWAPAGNGSVPVGSLALPGKLDYSVDGGSSWWSVPVTQDTTQPVFLLDNQKGGANVVIHPLH